MLKEYSYNKIFSMSLKKIIKDRFNNITNN